MLSFPSRPVANFRGGLPGASGGHWWGHCWAGDQCHHDGHLIWYFHQVAEQEEKTKKQIALKLF